ncbi:MAG: dihydrofolate reductase family protein [Solirubrobacterales bacterium]|nr:dihydrofolate reductase family protein [Solirubrobacterales bacterium]
MRNVVAGVMISLDGVVEAPEAWTGPYFGPDLGQEVGSTMAQADTMLLGRKTYETFAASFASQSGGMADVMNSTPKLVASTTLKEATWQNSTLIGGDLAAELRRLKEQEGKNINISGSGTLIRSLLRDGLLDELRLIVFPVVVGSGARLFDGYDGRLGLTLAESKSFETGVVSLVYRPTAA